MKRFYTILLPSLYYLLAGVVYIAHAQLGSNVCSPNASSYGCMSIMSVGLGSTTWNNSAAYPNCGAAYTGTGTNSNFTFNGAAGQTVTMSITAGNYYGYYYDGYLFGWVDWNNDGDFYDSGEQIFSYWYIYQSASRAFPIPATATMGPKRMRILFGYWYYVDYVYYAASNHPCAGTLTTYYNYGDFRDFTLNIIANNDAGVTSVTTSTPPPFPPGNNTIQAVVRNFGGNNITSVQVNWSVNDVNQTPVTWTGTLTPGSTTTVNLGTYNFPQVGALRVRAWTSNPNGVTDPVPANDASPESIFGAALSGTYTIGGSSPDFTDIVTPANQLTAGGTLGAVTFNIRPGTYSGHVFISNPPGNQQTRPIVFQSENGNAATVIIVHNGGTTQTGALNATGVAGGQPTVRLLNADWVTFRNVTISATGTGGSNWAVCAELMGNTISDGCDGVTFDGAVFTGRTASSFVFNDILLLSNAAYHTGLVVQNCTFNNGSAGMYIWRTTTPFMGGHRYIGNTFTDFFAGAIFSNVTDGLVIERNVIRSSSTGISAGMNIANNIGNCRIIKNWINLSGNQGTQTPGILLQARASGNPGAPLMANNFIRVSGAMWGLRCANTSNTKLFHNTIYAAGGSSATTGVALRVDGSTVGMSFNNNIFYVGTGAGAAIDANATGAFTSLDYNTYHTSGSVFGYWGATAVNKGGSGSELISWRSTSGRDANSQYAPITFANVGIGDLHLTQVDPRLYGLGSTSNGTFNIGVRNDVPDDIDGESRNRSEVYNGADQLIPVISFNPPPPEEVVGCQGSTMTISANAQVTYGAQLTFQWLRNGAPLVEGINGFSGTRMSTLQITNTVQSLHEGDYVLYVTATGGADPLTSSVIKVKVHAPIEIVQQPSSRVVCRGQEVAMSVIADGTVLGYQWMKDGRAIAGATNAILVVSNVDEGNSGRYVCVLFGTCGTDQVRTREAVIYIAPQTLISRQPDRVAAVIGGTARLSVEPTGAEIPGYSPQYQWYRGTSALNDDGRITGTRTSELTIRNVRQSDIGENYWCQVIGLCGSQRSDNGGLYIGQVDIVRAPQNSEVCNGQNAVMSVQVSSNIPGAEYEYQWYKDGQPLNDGSKYSGVRSNILQIRNAEVSDGGQYEVEIIANPGGASARTSGRLMVNETPQITGNVADIVVCEGEQARVSVQATGGSLRYQWELNGAPIPGATASSYEGRAVAAFDGVRIRCVVSNGCGEVRSREATVDVVMKPQIVAGPQGGVAAIGGSYSLRVDARGDNLRYQWKKDGQVIPGATGSEYRIDNIGSSDAGRYRVEVNNQCGSIESDEVVLAVSNIEADAIAMGYGIEVQPQPAIERVIVALRTPRDEAVVVEVIDGNGRTVGLMWRGDVGGDRKIEMDVSSLSSGAYRCVLRAGAYHISTPLIIVR